MPLNQVRSLQLVLFTNFINELRMIYERKSEGANDYVIFCDDCSSHKTRMVIYNIIMIFKFIILSIYIKDFRTLY